MRFRLKKWLLPFLLTLLLVACKTTIAVEMTAPPELDYGAAPVLRVEGQEQDELSDYLVQKLESLLSSDESITLLSSDADEKEAELLLRFRIQNIIDNYEDSYIDVEDEQKEDKAFRVYTYQRSSTVYVYFELLEKETGIIRDSIDAFENAKSVEDDFNNLVSFENLHYQAIDQILDQYRFYFISQRYTDFRVLEKLQDNKDPRLDSIKRMIKSKDYRTASALYQDIYQEKSDTAAWYNSILLKEISGDHQQAIEEMKKLIQETGFRNAQKQLDRMLEQEEDRQKLTTEE